MATVLSQRVESSCLNIANDNCLEGLKEFFKVTTAFGLWFAICLSNKSSHFNTWRLNFHEMDESTWLPKYNWTQTEDWRVRPLSLPPVVTDDVGLSELVVDVHTSTAYPLLRSVCLSYFMGMNWRLDNLPDCILKTVSLTWWTSRTPFSETIMLWAR